MLHQRDLGKGQILTRDTQRGGYILVKGACLVSHTAGEHLLAQPVILSDGQCAGNLESHGLGVFFVSHYLICDDATLYNLSFPQPGHCDLLGTEVCGLADEFGLSRVEEGVSGWDKYSHIRGQLHDP